MSTPNKLPRLGQLLEDVEAVYGLVANVEKTAEKIAATQKSQGQRLNDLRGVTNAVRSRVGKTLRQVTVIDEVQKLHSARFNDMDDRFNDVESRLRRLDNGQRTHGEAIQAIRLEQMDRFHQIETVQRDHSTKMEHLDTKVEQLDTKVEQLDMKIDKVIALLSPEK